MNARLRKILRSTVCAVLTVCVLAALGGYVYFSSLLPAQKAYVRWQGESEQRFAQLSVFLPVDAPIGKEQVWSFEGSALEALKKASMDTETQSLLLDAWSAHGKVSVRGEIGNAEASVIAVGGSFFEFHPVQLLSGCYLRESDVSKDLVLLDEELAWRLFGGYELQGLTVTLEGHEFTVGGVIERETDFADRLAYTSGMGLYMSYDAYRELYGESIDCYELVLAEPVVGFARQTVTEHFPAQKRVLVENSARYSVKSVFSMLKDFGKRSMQTEGVLYPYWENAARCVEDYCALMLGAVLLCGCYPALCALWGLGKLLVTGKRKLETEWIPAGKAAIDARIEEKRRERYEADQKTKS